MALDEKLKKKEEVQEEDGDDIAALNDEQEENLEMAVLLAKQLIAQGGSEVLDAAKTSKDPGQVIGQFLVQLGSQMGEQLPPEVSIDPVIMLCEGGWVEQISDFLQEEYDVSREDADRAEIYVATTAEQIAKGQQAQQAGATPAQEGGMPPAGGQPAMPQGAV